MRVVPVGPTHDEVFSLDEVARAARVVSGRLREWLEEQSIPAASGFLSREDAVRAVRHLRGGPEAGPAPRAPLTLLPRRRRKAGASLLLSGLLHGAMLVLLLTLASLGLLNSVDTEQTVVNPTPIRLVFLMSPGPGGGGGGGGLKMPAPPPPAERKAPPKVQPKPKSPVPPVKKVARTAAGRDAPADADADRDATGADPPGRAATSNGHAGAPEIHAAPGGSGAGRPATGR